jgi:hypothetical protein
LIAQSQSTIRPSNNLALVGEWRDDFDNECRAAIPVSAPRLRQFTGSSSYGVFGVGPDARRVETRRDIGFEDTSHFQPFGDSQIGVVGLKPDFPVDDLQSDYRSVNAPRLVPTFTQNIEGRRSHHRA